MDPHLWRQVLAFPTSSLPRPRCHDTAVLIAEAESCKSLVSQQKITWKNKRDELFHQQECTAKL